MILHVRQQQTDNNEKKKKHHANQSQIPSCIVEVVDCAHVCFSSCETKLLGVTELPQLNENGNFRLPFVS